MDDEAHRVLVADDHPVVREGIRAVLQSDGEFEVADEATTIPGVLDALERGDRWDLILLDLSMPGGEGTDLVQKIRALSPELPVLVFSVHAEEELALTLLQAGADGYVEKSAGVEQLLTAARRVLDGETYVSRDLASRFADALAGGRDERRHERLSGREFQVLRLFGEGKSVSDIAELLSLSVKTVSTYRSRILEKMEMDSTAELIRYTIDRGLVR